jgi:predicted TIM-barrel fold metal-dependent hydrolase
MIVDVHTHHHLPEHWGNEHKDHWEPVYGEPYPVVTPESFDAAMSEAGVDVAVVFGLAATRAGVHTPNRYAADFCRLAKTPTVPFVALDPTDDDWLDQLDEACDLGFQGVKLYPVLAHFDPFAPENQEFFRVADKRGLVLLWHMGATPSPPGRLALSQPLVVDEVARRFPSLTQVIAHMGHPWQRDTNVVLRKNPRVFADVSASWSRTMDGYLALVNAQEWGTVDKLLFGSDYPLWTPRQAMTQFRALAKLRSGDLPYVAENTVESIIHRDTLRLLGLTDPRGGGAS